MAKSELGLSASFGSSPAWLWLGVACLLAVLGWPVVCHLSRQTSQGQESDIYEDNNGRATVESLKRFSNAAISTIIIGTLVVDFVLSLLSLFLILVYSSRYSVFPHAIQTGLYTLALSHSISLRFVFAPGPRTCALLYGFYINVISMVVPYVVATENDWVTSDSHSADDMVPILAIGQLLGGFLCSLCHLFLARRPDVYVENDPVDRQDSVSIWNVLAFSWAADSMRTVAEKQSLGPNDLPRLPERARSSHLHGQLERALMHCGLLSAVLSIHWPALVVQQVLTLATVSLGFAPQFSLFHILKCLEKLEQNGSQTTSALVWVMALGGFMALSTVAESWLYWLVISRIAIPIRKQLSAAVYAKAMRSHVIIKTATKEEMRVSEDELEEPGITTSRVSGQNPSTLVAVDVKRVSNEAAYSYTTTAIFFKLVVACMFLVSLLGWRSTIAGLSVAMMIVPVGIRLSKQFAKSQTALMASRDERIATVSEALNGIREVKLGAHEGLWHTRISIMRRSELRAQWTCFLYDIGLLAICMLGPIILSIVSLGTYVKVNGPLTPSVAFTAIAAFGSLEISFANLPNMATSLMEAYVSLERIEEFLNADDFEPATIQSEEHADCIIFDNATIAYPHADDDARLEDRFVLSDLSFSFPPGGFSVISGKTGSGKSLVLSAILGECDIFSGAVRIPAQPLATDCPDNRAAQATWIVKSRIGFVPQTPWVENMTVRDNILFGLPYCESRYRQTLAACDLEVDVGKFPHGELTRIGPHGIRLSGGQKWRISLARALYSRAGILLLDDIFGAVDVHTARHLCERALAGPLAENRTRILVTHHTELCSQYANLAITLGVSGAWQTSVQDSMPPTPMSTPTLIDIYANGDLIDSETSEPEASRDHVTVNMTRPERHDLGNETSATGAVKTRVYMRYIKAGGNIWIWSFIIMAYISYMALNLARPWWVNLWTKSVLKGSEMANTYGLKFQPFSVSIGQNLDNYQLNATGNLGYYLSVYVLISFLSCLAGSTRYFLILSASIRASRALFDGLLFSVLHAPIQWFDSVPVGRVLNRFAADMSLVDSELSYDIGALSHRLFEVVGIAISGTVASPLTLVFSLIPVVGACYYAPRYLAAARQIKRLESAAISPVLEQFGSSLTGLTTIRAFSNVSLYVSRMYGLLDQHGQASWHLWLFNRWFNLRMNLTGTLYCVLTATLVVLLPGVEVSIVGFVLSFAIQYPSALLWTVRQYTNVELSMSSVERVIEYENMDLENQGGHDAPEAWPRRGEVEVRDLSVGFGQLPPVLKNIGFTIEAGQRVGVVGRTGAGKSSLTLALFRFLEAREGSIWIDGIDISTLKLEDLRSRLQIIPQDPIFFSGTIRSNLDPHGKHTDAELYQALERLQLLNVPTERTDAAAKDKNIFASLSSAISEKGSSLSAGQRQLLSLCRAFLTQPKFLVLDEATSGVDITTDALIQRAIREEASRSDTTMLVIAHRLSTVVDFDAILVLDSGRLVESGPAHHLMAIEDGVFRSMVHGAADRCSLEESIFKAL
ncbi:P-loop containing nucleoside triphosphate hydrolase protein [Thelonectria olida]|uniref:P-loop containing nucleoside triphosphate hydrolase protein n=1 Tax=Thelonectria olida TaxID=1576542 RepID=A0A9P8VXG8_9HYPO|nr:P-loop containing nucleoside triphosphate hydrolase protein [Thelonectria olida]